MNILIVSAVSDFGGVEVELGVIMDLATSLGYRVSFVSMNHLKKEGYIFREYSKKENVDLYSLPEFFGETLLGKIFYYSAKIKYCFKNRRVLQSDREAYGYRFARRFRNRFWSLGKGREFIDESEFVILIGQPVNVYTDLLESSSRHGKSLIFRITGSIFSSHMNNSLYKKFLDKIDLIDKIIVHSKSNRNKLVKYLKYRGAIDIVDQFAIDEEEYLSLRRSGTGDSFVMGVIARLSPEKKIGDVIEAFAKFMTDFQKKSLLVLAGDGPCMEKLKRKALELGVASYVKFPGYLEGRDKIDFYRTIDVFILSSAQESGPVTGVEAMAAGLPIISTPVGAMPERLEKSGQKFLFDVGDIEMLTEHMKTLSNLSPEQLEKTGLENRKAYIRHYSRKEILSLYKKTVFEKNIREGNEL